MLRNREMEVHISKSEINAYHREILASTGRRALMKINLLIG